MALECGDQQGGSACAQGEWRLVVFAAYLSEVSVQDLGICVSEGVEVFSFWFLVSGVQMLLVRVMVSGLWMVR